jgi:hypothetical protein
MLDWLAEILMIAIVCLAACKKSACGAIFIMPILLGYVAYYDYWGIEFHLPMAFIIACVATILFTRKEEESDLLLFLCGFAIATEYIGWRLWAVEVELYIYQPLYILIFIAAIYAIGSSHGGFIRTDTWRRGLLDSFDPCPSTYIIENRGKEA